MDRRTFVTTGVSGLVTAGAAKSFSMSAPAEGSIHVQNGAAMRPTKEAVFFPFDRESMPFSNGLRIVLIPGKKPGKPNPIVVNPGEPGAPDDKVVRFYGTVIPMGDTLHMWYLARANSDHGGGQLRICYATSTDGAHWTKPNLGLVEFQGSKANNIVNIRGGRPEFAGIPILYDPEDPDESRRYKMVFESEVQKNHLSAAYSPDGLNWTESPNNPLSSTLEPTGLIKLNGCYFVNGQGGWHYGLDRQLVTYASYDFERWTQATCMGFKRNVPPPPMGAAWNSMEEAHLGAGMWDRGNVILGIYDMWHGPQDSDRGHAGMDLGFLVTHDALHFYEPISNFRFLPAYEELMMLNGVPTRPDPPLYPRDTVSHGQGMCNWGEHTMLWYEFWGAGGIRLATWPRDRMGCFRAIKEDLLTGLTVSSTRGDYNCITCPFEVGDSGARVYVNADGLGEHSELSVEILDQGFRPIDGYSEKSVVPLRESGLKIPVRWNNREALNDIKGPIRIRVNFRGVRPDDAQLYAVYVA